MTPQETELLIHKLIAHYYSVIEEVSKESVRLCDARKLIVEKNVHQEVCYCAFWSFNCYIYTDKWIRDLCVYGNKQLWAPMPIKAARKHILIERLQLRVEKLQLVLQTKSYL